MEGDPESSLNASGGDHPFDYRDSKGGDPAGQDSSQGDQEELRKGSAHSCQAAGLRRDISL